MTESCIRVWLFIEIFVAAYQYRMGKASHDPSFSSVGEGLSDSIVAMLTKAFKEWSVVVDALEAGSQALILRKGGLHEGKGGFGLESQEFWLFPTHFHQHAEGVLPSSQERHRALLAQAPPAEVLRIRSFARIHRAGMLREEAHLRALLGHHIWTEDVVRDRFHWGRKTGLFLLLVRVYVLPESVDLPMLESYGGCKSWIDLENPPSPDVAVPVLDDSRFLELVAPLMRVLDLEGAG